MGDKIGQVMQRTYRYYYDERLVELAIGGLFLSIGILIRVWASMAFGSPLALGITLALFALVIGGGLLVKQAVGRIKERVTYPRTGYVSYRQHQPARGRWLLIGVAAAYVLLIFVLPEWFSKMALAEGVLLLVVLSYMGYRVGEPRFYLVGVTAGLIGLGAALLIPDDLVGSSVTFGGTGIALLLSGVWALRAYLQAHPNGREDLP